MQIKPGKTKIGWIGTGIMGSSMAGHLIKGGYSLRVHNRTPAKAEELLEAGAEWADTPSACAADADVVFTIVGFPADVEEVHLGDNGIIQTIRAGAIVVDMTTSAPSLARKLAEAYAAKDVLTL
ncbi:MAG: NAD(P)-binding domain-containing protein, partial [Phycisphaerae bacterium]|nr:NAD(P)-binding domain-containing protein [Phycisphaerae bacterium]